jgi:hypothetical protein
MTVALAVLAVVLALAFGLLVRTGTLGAELGRSVSDSGPELFLSQFRRDVQAARSATALDPLGLGRGSWDRGGVSLAMDSGSGGPSEVVYLHQGGRLVRFAESVDPSTVGPGSGRTVLDEVLSWRWRLGGGCPGEAARATPLPSGRLLAVEVTYRPQSRRRGAIATGGRLPRAEAPEVLERCYTLRGGGLGEGW